MKSIKEIRTETKQHKNKTKYNYICGWCGNRFERWVSFRGGVSDQVQCDRCGNFVSTYNKKNKRKKE